MDKEFMKWLEAERDEAFELSTSVRYRRRQLYWSEQFEMLSDAVNEIKTVMYKEATGR